MKGHHALIDMRQKGRHPKWVFVNDYPCKTDWHEWGEHATICVAGDSLADIDLRCLVGLNVSVSSPNLARAKALFEVVKASGVAAVAASSPQAERHHTDQAGGWSQVWVKPKPLTPDAEQKLEVCCA